jgi:hypothetical protein
MIYFTKEYKIAKFIVNCLILPRIKHKPQCNYVKALTKLMLNFNNIAKINALKEKYKDQDQDVLFNEISDKMLKMITMCFDVNLDNSNLKLILAEYLKNNLTK